MADITSTGLSHGNVITITNPGSGYFPSNRCFSWAAFLAIRNRNSHVRTDSQSGVAPIGDWLNANYFAVEAGNNDFNIVSGRTDSTALGECGLRLATRPASAAKTVAPNGQA